VSLAHFFPYESDIEESMERYIQRNETGQYGRGIVMIGLIGLLIGLLAGNETMADGSQEAGQTKAVTCAACHGPDGNSQNPEWPTLAGQNKKYLIKSLQAYKNGSRSNVLMTGQAAALNDQDIEDLAAYFASQTAIKRTADPALVPRGERLYRGGNMDRGVSACIACHGPTGRGNPAAGYPSLAGQHAVYTAAQLHAYAAQDRKSDVAQNQMMRNIAVLLTDDDITAVASYIQGLQ
jgi:cytochrome c553